MPGGNITMVNLFKRLACFGEEDFFTASLALFIERNEPFRKAFLDWLEPLVGENLSGYAWEVRIQDCRTSQYGEAILDMVLAHPEIELWFEHKVGAALGKYDSQAGEQLDQLQKYLDAAARVMTGTDDAKQSVTWPEGGPASGRPRILLFYISRSGKALERDKYQGKLHSPGKTGLVFPENNQQLRWRDFFPLGSQALEDSLNGSEGPFDATLAQQFLDYWQGIRGMWRQLEFNDAWLELLPPEEGLSIHNPAPFVNYLNDIEDLFVSKLGWRAAEHWGGNAVVFKTPVEKTTTISFHAIRSIESIPNYCSALGTEVVRVTARFAPEHRITRVSERQVRFESFRGLFDYERVASKDVLHIYVGINDWNGIHTKDWRYRQITLAFVAGLRMAEQAFEIAVDGLGVF